MYVIALNYSYSGKCQMKVVEKIQNTHLLFKNCSRKSCRLWDNAQKYGRARQATDDDMAHAHCTLDSWGYKHTLRICNTYCFSTVTVVSRTRLGVPLYLHCNVLLLSTCVVVVFWEMTRCGMANGCHCFVGNCCYPTHPADAAGETCQLPNYRCDKLKAHRQSSLVVLN